MSDEPKLAPCPFCGTAVDDLYIVPSDDPKLQYVECHECGAYGPDGGASHWNRRAPAPAVPPVEQEPVAWVERLALDALMSKEADERLVCKAWSYKATSSAVPLYARPVPAPAVPDDVAVEILTRTAARADAAEDETARLRATIEAQAAEIALLKKESDHFSRCWEVQLARAEAQAAELARLQYLQGRDQASRQYHIKKRREIETENRRLTDLLEAQAAELARYREALESIGADFARPEKGQTDFGERMHYLHIACRLRDEARAALTQPTGDRT